MGNWKLTGPHPGATRDWSEIDVDVLELILLKLPETSVIRAGSVCSRWNSTARSEAFTQLYVKHVGTLRACPRFTVKGSKYCFRPNEAAQHDTLVAFDSSKVPYLLRPNKEAICHEGAGGLLYFFTEPAETVVYYKLSRMQQEWMVTPEKKSGKHEPMVGVLRSGVNGAHKLVVAGGIVEEGENDEDLAVEIFDSVSGTWQMGSPLPHVFRGCTTSLFMNPAVYDGKFYAYDNYASFCSVLDVCNNYWSTPKVVQRPSEVKQSYLVESSAGLSLVGVQDANSRDLLFSVWNVDPKSLELNAQTQETIIVNARAALPSTARRSFDVLVDRLGVVIGSLLLLIAYVVVVVCRWLTSSRCHLQNLILSFLSPLPPFPDYASHALKQNPEKLQRRGSCLGTATECKENSLRHSDRTRTIFSQACL